MREGEGDGDEERDLIQRKKLCYINEAVIRQRLWRRKNMMILILHER